MKTLHLSILAILLVITATSNVAFGEYDSPLKQFNSEVLSKFVKCNYGLHLLMNKHNFHPACVKEASTTRLLNQDWMLPSQCITGPVDTHFTLDVGGAIVIQKNASSPDSGKSYDPRIATVVIGLNNTVVWFNTDDFSSSVTSNDGIFDSGPILPNHTWKYKFECAGKYEYHSEPHPWMKGIVVVLPLAHYP